MTTGYEGPRGVTDVARNARHGCYAYFPGTGPENTTCGKCAAFEPQVRSAKGWCLRYQEMTGDRRRTQGTRIGSSDMSCKYFEEAPKDRKGTVSMYERYFGPKETKDAPIQDPS